MKRILIILLSIIFLVSCNQNKSYITIVKETTVDSIYIPMNDSIYTELGYGQIINEQNNVLISQHYKYGLLSNDLYFHDLNTKKQLNKIIYKSYPNMGSLSRFLYVNSDSIFLFISNYNRVDTALILINEKGITKKIYTVDNPFFTTKAHPFDSDSSLISFSFFTTVPVYQDNKIFFGTNLYFSSNFGSEKFCKNKYPIVGYFDLEKDTVVLNNEIWFPNCVEGNLYPNNAKDIILSTSYNGNILIGFANTSKVLEWDYKHNKVTEQNLISMLVDTIMPQKLLKNYISTEQPYNYKICYIDSLNLYARTILLPRNVYGDLWNIVTLYDTNYSYIGETYNSTIGFNTIIDEVNSEWRTDITQKKWNRTEYKDSIKLVKKEYKFGKLDIEALKTKMYAEMQKASKGKEEKLCRVMGSDYEFKGYTNELMINYTKKMFNIEDSTTFTMFVITDKDCHSCDDYTLQFMEINRGVINSTNTCLLLAGENVDYFNRLVDEYNLKGIKKFAIDSTGIYTDLHHFTDNNPRLLLVRDNKVISDTIYMPDDLENMMMDYINFFSFEAEKKSN